MSRGNIVFNVPDPTGGTVTFQCRDGSLRSYHYGLKEYAAIAAGADPRDEPQGADGKPFDFAVGEAIEATEAAAPLLAAL